MLTIAKLMKQYCTCIMKENLTLFTLFTFLFSIEEGKSIARVFTTYFVNNKLKSYLVTLQLRY